MAERAKAGAERRSPSRGRPPGRALALAYLAVSLLPLALAALVSAAPLHPWEAIGAALGSVALAAMAIQFLTSGRFEAASGTLGIDEIMAFHKVAALWVLVALVLHPLLYVLPTWRADPDLGLERLIHYHTAPHYRSGVVALAALVLLVPLGYLRARLPVSYEVWRASHVALTLVAVGAGLHHVLTVGRFSVAAPVQTVWWAVAALVAAVMAVLYGLRWARLHRRPWSLGSVTRRADRTWELDIQPDPGTPPLDYEAGQFVWMTEGARRFPLFDHPFSIADSPHRPGLSLIVKEAGDFTDRIGTLAPGTPIGIDGPHGSFTLDRRDADAFVLIAGGVGIAPILGLLRELVARRDPRPVRFVYAVGAPDNFACLDEIEAAKAVLDLQVTLLSETAGAGYEGAVGRLDRDRLGTVLEGLDRGRTAVLMCGPGGMITAVSDTLLDLGLPMDAVEYERFDYAGGLRARKDRRRMAQFLGIGLTLFAAAAGLSLLLA